MDEQKEFNEPINQNDVHKKPNVFLRILKKIAMVILVFIIFGLLGVGAGVLADITGISPDVMKVIGIAVGTSVGTAIFRRILK